MFYITHRNCQAVLHIIATGGEAHCRGSRVLAGCLLSPRGERGVICSTAGFINGIVPAIFDAATTLVISHPDYLLFTILLQAKSLL
jgi:hypothetical protein